MRKLLITKKFGGLWARLAAFMAVMMMTTAQVYAQQTAVKYIDKDGVEQTCSTYNTVETSGTEVTWDGSSNDGWYVVSGTDLTITGGATVSGAVHLILADGASLTVTGAAGKAGINVITDNSLTVYGQIAGTGVLIATGGDKGAGIGGGKGQDSGDITINGGTVTATGAGGGAGIGGGIGGSIGDIVINHGTVVATGSLLATGIGAGDIIETVNFGNPDLNWSVYNFGATNCSTAESWYGDYYAWGATTTWYSAGYAQENPQEHWKDGYSDGYSWAHCPHTYGTYSSSNQKVFTKYVPQDKASTYGYGGHSDTFTVLEADDDAAHAVLGGDWRMPTQKEWQDLYDNNTFEWLDADNPTSAYVQSFTAVAAGYLVVKGGKNSIQMDKTVYMFLPAAGYYTGSSLYNAGSYGDYWSSSLYASNPDRACNLSFGSGKVYVRGSLRDYGRSVRPVCQLQD